MSLNKMIRLPSELIPFAKGVPSDKCNICPFDHRYYCLKCNRLQPFCLKCKICKRPRQFICTETSCITLDETTESARRFTCKYCRPVEKMTEFDNRPPPRCLEGSFTSLRIALTDLTVGQKALLKERQKPCAKCNNPMPLTRKCFYCYVRIEISCTKDECLPKTLDVRINPHWICENCQIKHYICPMDVENFCLSCKKDQPIALKCDECSAKFTLACTFPYLCYNTVKLVDKKRLCKKCEGPARFGFAMVEKALCDSVAKDYKMADEKRAREAAATKKAAEDKAAKEDREKRKEIAIQRFRRNSASEAAATEATVRREEKKEYEELGAKLEAELARLRAENNQSVTEPAVTEE